TVRVIAETANSAPVANAGSAQNVQTSTLVSLDGTGSSDADGDTLTYQWSFTNIPATSSATLNDATLASPSFTADVDGEYVAQLIVNDGQVNSDAVTVRVIAETANSAPVANAGSAQNVQTSTLVSLDGTGSSDADGDTLTYQWSFTNIPATSSATLNDATLASPSFTADVDGEYVAQLIVNDGQVNSDAVTVRVIAETANSAPVANAGDDKATVVGEVIYLDGTASSDADNDELSYSWSFISKPQDSVAELDNTEVYNPSFIVDKSGDYVVGLIVSDSIDQSEQDLVKISAIEPQVRLYKEGGSIFDPAFSEISFPYSTSGSMSVNVNGIPAPTSYTIGKYKLLAEGDNFTITNVIAIDSTNQVNPYFNGISDSFELAEGTEVEFELISPLTRNKTTNLTFSFEILETGETFNANYVFTSN
ncbi:MAG: PKD domain-containing protein, partial [Pseudoalteromonas prydzensis]|uniref:PKD domain-containing protein n=1 Tax=Pseudoalteromonas prydzensis TaxID=182141 RepID=UPI003F979258